MATQRADGRWVARARTPEGRIVAYGRTAEEADAALQAKLATPSEPPPTPSTVHDAAVQWWLPRVQRKCKALTVRRYTDCYVTHVRDVIGLKPLKALTTNDVQGVIDRMADRGLSSSSQSVCRTVISTILREAMKRGAIDRLVTADRLVEVSPAPPKRAKVLSPGDAAELLDQMEGTPLAAPVFLAVVLGLRRGEIAGLRWSDLDRQRRELIVCRQRQQVYGERKAKPRKRGTAVDAVQEGPLKGSSTGTARVMSLTPAIIEGIDRRGNLDSEHICTCSKGRPWRPDSLTRCWTVAAESLLPGWTLHDLRHGAGGLLRAAGADMTVTARTLGHSDTRTTQIYVDADRSDVGRAIEGVDNLIRSARRKCT